MTSRIAVVDLFCGMGGFSSGAAFAGAQVVLAIDSWAEALDVHKLNHPRCAHIQLLLGGDHRQVVQLIRRHLKPGQRWHLHGSPPCQMLSNANWRRNEKKGMHLVNWFLELVRLCRPDTWSMEQVRGAAKYLNPSSFDFYHVVNAANYGIPQNRKRLYVGNGWTLPPPSAPTPLIQRLPYLAKEGNYIRGYNFNKAVYKNGKYVGCKKLTGTEGFKTLNEPMFTLCASTWGRLLSIYRKVRNRMVKVRPLSVKEWLAIQGFPIDYRFPPHINDTTRKKLIGNSLCPIFAFLIIRSVQKHQN